MVERISPLAGLTGKGVSGIVGEAGPGVRLSTRTDLSLWQAAAWPQTAKAVANALGKAAGVKPPAPGRVAEGKGGALVRLSPLKWWLLDGATPALKPEQGATLDLSHEQTPIRVEGRDAAALLARIVAVDLRDAAFPVGAFAATGGHHMMLKLWRRGPESYELFVMRSFARDLWSALESHARQFGVEAA
jgi:sarcosine oxidase subunit gamma